MPEARKPRTGDGRPTRNIPPLVWIILAILVVWVILWYVMRSGEHVTPQGGTMPMARPDTSYMPPAPASGDAPGTAGGPVTSPAPSAPRP